MALDVEVNLCSRVFQTSLKLVTPTTSENTCGVRVEFIKERSALSLVLQDWNSRLTTEVVFPDASSTKGDGFGGVPSICSTKEQALSMVSSWCFHGM